MIEQPYWFIGKEPGGADDTEQYASWLRLGGDELIDCGAHDRDCSTDTNPPLWHGVEPGPNLQPTWRPLIAMLLAYRGAAACDEHAVRRYQDERWGRSDGETALLELSAIAAPSVSHDDAMRLMHLEERIATIRRRLEEHRPQLVVFTASAPTPCTTCRI